MPTSTLDHRDANLKAEYYTILSLAKYPAEDKETTNEHIHALFPKLEQRMRMLDGMSRIVRTRSGLISGLYSAFCKNRMDGNGTRDHRTKTNSNNNNKPPTRGRDEGDNRTKHQKQPPKKTEQRKDKGYRRRHYESECSSVRVLRCSWQDDDHG